MSFNFPNSPTDGMIHTPVAGRTYTFSGGVWKTSGGSGGGSASIVVSDTAPPAPQAGAMWWESDTGNLYIYYDDGNSLQWVQVAAPPSPAAQLTAQTRNRLVNPALQITQETARGTVLAGGANIYHSDQWLETQGIDGTCTIANVVNTYLGADAGPYCATLVIGTADASIAAGQYVIATSTALEGIRIADFNWGTANALPVVVRFKATSTVATTFTFYIVNGAAGNRNYVRNCVIAANTPTWFTFAIPGDTTGTWVTDNTKALNYGIAVAVGSSFHATEATWGAGNLFGTAAIGNLCATSGARFSAGAFGLYLDPDATGVPPKWVMPDEAEELRACQRYWQTGVNVLYSGSATNAQVFYAQSGLIVPMRSTPNLTGVNAASNGFPATVGALGMVTPMTMRENRTCNVTATNSFFHSNLVANARM